ncbi:MAG: hypothetical protein AB7R89_33010 [Dehalococcoidia bacterium]
MDVALFVVQAASLVALIIYVYKTWEIAAATRDAARASATALVEMREGRDQEIAPYVIAYFDVSEGRHIIRFVVENIGKSMAHDVRIAVVPPLQSTVIEDIDQVDFIRDGIPSLAPRQALRTFIDTTFNYLNRSDLPQSYQVVITYTGGLHTAPRTTTQLADLTVYRGVRASPEKGLHQLVQEVERLRDTVDGLRRTIDIIATKLVVPRRRRIRRRRSPDRPGR